MKEIVVISGKGGTGKTSLTASFAVLGGKSLVTADCDVDAADMHILLQPEVKKAEDFYSGVLASIDPSLCTGCGACDEVCRFDALEEKDGVYSVIPLNCEGCGYCARICPGKQYAWKTRTWASGMNRGSKPEHLWSMPRLGIGAENSGKLVAKVKNEAKRIAREQECKIVLVDGSPGIGCPVVSSLSGADFVVFVTEPTVSGLHDFKAGP